MLAGRFTQAVGRVEAERAAGNSHAIVLSRTNGAAEGILLPRLASQLAAELRLQTRDDGLAERISAVIG